MLSKAFVLLAIQTALATASVAAPNAHVERSLTPLVPVEDTNGKHLTVIDFLLLSSIDTCHLQSLL